MRPTSSLPWRGAETLWLVVLVVVAGCGEPSAPPTPPPAPTDLSAAPASDTEVRLAWDAAADPSVFVVDRATEDAGYVTIDTIAGDARTYADDGLEQSTTYRYRLRACENGLCSAASAPAVAETFAELRITTLSLPAAIVGEPYNEAVFALGGDGEHIWRVSAGSLPPGLALGDTSGIISGIPQTAGTYVFTLEVRSGELQTATRDYAIEVLSEAPPTSIETHVLPPVMNGGSYQVALEANGGDGTYEWSVVSGALPPGLSLSTGGVISGTPTATGTYTFTVAADGGGSTGQKEFTIRVDPNVTTSFNITEFAVVNIPDSIRPHVDSALARWERVVTGDLGAASVAPGFFEASDCGGFGGVVNGTTTDDVIMIINIAPIDGPGQVLGQAGPCALRGSSDLPFVGFLTLDSEDLSPLVNSETLTYILFHEMGHILGIGTLWSRFGLLQGAGTMDPRFTGSEAVAEWQALGRTGTVPVESQGGPGTADGHWREAIFDEEILTGFSEKVGVEQPLSRVTIASLADLGYQVDLGQADPFTLGMAGIAAGDAHAGDLGYDIVYGGPVLVLEEDGTVHRIELR